MASIPLDDLLLADEVPAVLAGAAAVPDGEPGSGPLDVVAAAAAELDQQAEEALLLTRRFVRGHQRTWTTADPSDLAHAFVYEFADPAGAAAYLVDGREHLAARGASFWTVAGVAGASGFTQTDSSGPQTLTYQGVAFSRDRWFFLVVARGSAIDPGVVSSLAAEQAARATASLGG